MTVSAYATVGATGKSTTIYVLVVEITVATELPKVTETALTSDIGNPVPTIVIYIPP